MWHILPSSFWQCAGELSGWHTGWLDIQCPPAVSHTDSWGGLCLLWRVSYSNVTTTSSALCLQPSANHPCGFFPANIYILLNPKHLLMKCKQKLVCEVYVGGCLGWEVVCCTSAFLCINSLSLDHYTRRIGVLDRRVPSQWYYALLFLLGRFWLLTVPDYIIRSMSEQMYSVQL